MPIATTIPFRSSPITNVAITITNAAILSNHKESALGFFFFLVFKNSITGASPVALWLSVHVPLRRPQDRVVRQLVRIPGADVALLVKPCCGRRPTYKVEEDGHEC